MSATEIGFVMITEDLLAKEFARIIQQYYPAVGELLDGCYVKVISSYWGRPPKRIRYIGRPPFVVGIAFDCGINV